MGYGNILTDILTDILKDILKDILVNILTGYCYTPLKFGIAE